MTKTKPRQFASDNYAGICPEAWAAMQDANRDHDVGYGDDAWTTKAADMIREIFETDCEVFFVFNGTSANSLSLASLCQSYHSFLCHEIAHVEVAECGAPEFFGHGTKVLLLPGANGKIDPAGIENAVRRREDIHYPKPRAVTLTQATEVGTVYSAADVVAVHEATLRCKKDLKRELRIHMDGARFANAVASMKVAPKTITWQAGVDVLSFGGTKNGLAVGEAVVFFNRDLAHEFDYRCKQGGQLASKMRFLSAPWVGMLRDGAWLRHAAHANEMALLLESRLRGLPQIKIEFPVQTNAVFASIPDPIVKALHQRGWKFYTNVGVEFARLMCSWDTTKEDVDNFAADVKELAGAK